MDNHVYFLIEGRKSQKHIRAEYLRQQWESSIRGTNTWDQIEYLQHIQTFVYEHRLAALNALDKLIGNKNIAVSAYYLNSDDEVNTIVVGNPA